MPFVLCAGCSESEEEDEDMDVEAAAQQADEVSQALAAADALGRTPTMDIAESLRELDMENYDEEDDGICICLCLS